MRHELLDFYQIQEHQEELKEASPHFIPAAPLLRVSYLILCNPAGAGELFNFVKPWVLEASPFGVRFTKDILRLH